MLKTYSAADIVSRRLFISRGTLALAAVGSAGCVSLGSPGQSGGAPCGTPSPLGKGKFDVLRKSELVEGGWTRYGRLRTLNADIGGSRVCVPLSLSSPGDISAIDWLADSPTIRLGDAIPLLLTPTGVQLKKGETERPWSNDTTKVLLDTIGKSEELQLALIALRTSWWTAYPEQCYRAKTAAPAKLAKRIAASNASVAQFGKGKNSETCKAERIVETITTTVTREQNVYKTAAQQLDQCFASCNTKFGSNIINTVDLGICHAQCLLEGFVDIVTGTIEVLDTLVQEVVTTVTVCSSGLPKGKFPNPFVGTVEWPGLSGAVSTPRVDPGILKQAQSVVASLLKRMPPIVTCLIGGAWKVTDLRDLGLNIDGVASVPFGVTVCLNPECAKTIMKGGGFDGMKTVAELVGLANGVPAIVATLGLTAAAATAVVQVAVLLFGLIAVLMMHLVVVAGQIQIYDWLGLCPNGVCITHPSLPVVAAAAANPLLGVLAVANTPLVVTPA
jgi:hypothetical protein